MADITVDAAVSATLEHNYEYGPFWTDADTGYAFMIDGSAATFGYRKTTDGGQTWGSLVTIGNDAGQNALYRFHVWFERNTPGDTGTKIHCAWQEWGDDSLRYRSLDTATDTLGTERTVASGLSYNPSTASWAATHVAITKARGGNLYIAFASSGNGFYRSTDGGTTWTSRSDHIEIVSDLSYLLPANTSDTQDICAIYVDTSANAISIKMYDDSANTWTETAIATQADNILANNFAATVRHSDGHVLLAFWNAYDATTADLQTYDITVNSIASPTVTATANVLTNSAESAQCCIFIDQATNDVYVGYLRTGTSTWTVAVNVYYKKSTDDMATWGSEVAYSEDAEDDYRQLSCGLGVADGEAGRFYIIWNDDDDNDLLSNYTNSIEITGGGGGVAQDITGGTIASGSSLSAPSLAHRIAGATIASGSALNAPTVTTGAVTVAGGTIASASVVRSPSLAYRLVAASIASAAILSAPTVSAGGVSVTAAAIASASVLRAPTVAYQMTGPTRASASQLYAPTVAGVTAVTGGNIASASVLRVPSLAYQVVGPTIAATSTLQAPTITADGSVTGGTIASLSALHAPSAAYKVVGPTITSAMCCMRPRSRRTEVRRLRAALLPAHRH
jgi:hypothetical protein